MPKYFWDKKPTDEFPYDLLRYVLEEEIWPFGCIGARLIAWDVDGGEEAYHKYKPIKAPAKSETFPGKWMLFESLTGKKNNIGSFYFWIYQDYDYSTIYEEDEES